MVTASLLVAATLADGILASIGYRQRSHCGELRTLDD